MSNENKVKRLVLEILKVLQDNKHGGPMGAGAIAKELRKRGFDIGDRAVRYHLKHLDEKELTRKPGELTGRIITEKGEDELKDGLVGKRLGFTLGRIEELTFEMDYDLDDNKGTIISNLSLLDKNNVKKALPLMKKVIEKRLSPSPLIAIKKEGEIIGLNKIPEGKIGVATVCSITIDGILEKKGIPVTQKFGGVLEIENGEPRRFTDAIAYEASTLDPLDIFASREMTSYLKVIETGFGRILANLREIPVTARAKSIEVIEKAEENQLNGVLDLSPPGESLFGLPVGVNRVGIAVAGGINPAVAVRESGIDVETTPLDTLLEISEMKHIDEFL